MALALQSDEDVSEVPDSLGKLLHHRVILALIFGKPMVQGPVDLPPGRIAPIRRGGPHEQVGPAAGQGVK